MLLYNSLTRQKEELPSPPGPVRMYVCGPTVYQRIHVGNARPYVVFIWLKRWLELNGFDVTLVENVTDVNDKIYEAAAKKGIGSAELAAEATRWYLDDTDDLGLGRPDHEPLASETIPEIINLIEELVDGGLAYESQGDVYFRVADYPAYGELSGAKLEDMVAQEPSDLKEDQRDFALWKATKPDEDTSWESPWGPAARAGTSSARPWRRSSWARSSRSTAAASTSASRTTRTSSPNRVGPGGSSRGSGRTMGCSS